MTRPRRLKVIVEADGGSRGNPGPAGYGALVCEAGTGEVLVERAESLGTTTNNVAEYSGLIAGLQAAADLGAVDVEVRMDSQLVIEQMSGRWQIKNAGLRPLAAKAAALVSRFESVRFIWIPRERNKRADALANAAMDGRSIEDVDLSAPSLSPPSPSAPSLAGDTEPSAAPFTVAEGLAPSVGPRSWAPPSTGPATRLVLVRHGETEMTAQGRYSGRGDVELSYKGQLQAVAAAARVSTVVSDVAAILTSPLSRCVATAETIAADTHARVRPVADLIECDFGEWEGLTFADVRQRWPEQLDEWLGSTTVAPPGGESFADVSARVSKAVTSLLSEYAGKSIVVVSHVTPIKLILRDALAASDAFLYRLFLDPAGISIVDTWSDGGIAVRSVNDTAHLAAL